MKLARFLAKGRVHQGVYREGLLLDEAGEAHRPEDVTWLLPFTPGKILGVALNYADHAEELGLSRPEEPALFWKPNTSLLPHKGVVLYPKGARFVHYEVELAVVVGRPMKRVRAKDALDYVLGYTIANDLVARDYVTNTFRPPIRAKGRDTFLPWGPSSWWRRWKTPGPLASGLRERGAQAGGAHLEDALLRGGASGVHLRVHDPGALRRPPHRHPQGDQPGAARGRDAFGD